jgi:uncharacterized membrane protein
MHPFGFFPFGLLGWFGGLIFLAGLVLLAIWMFRSLAGPYRPAFAATSASHPQTPLEILQRRLASGEITADDYVKARDILGGSPPVKP